MKVTCSLPSCTKQWDSRGRGRPRLYCTEQCKEIGRAQPRRPRPSATGRLRRRCAECGTERPVSKRCKPEGQYRCNPCRRASREIRAQQQEAAVERSRLRNCLHCSAPFNRTTRYRQHCDACTAAQVWRCKRQRSARPQRKYLVRPPRPRVRTSGRTWVSGQCPICRTWFIGNDRRHTGCSRECMTETRRRTSARCNRESKRRRGQDHRGRARHYGVEYEPVNRYKVYARDGWRCGICRLKVDRRLTAPHPMSASLDHIVPMSRGGNHTYQNTQCAHWRCNVLKAATGAGDQLALIG